jgi:hypothetical protein
MSTNHIQKVSPADTPRERGARDYFGSAGKYVNPFVSGSESFNEYERGWMQSLKKDNAELVPAFNFTTKPSHGSAETSSVNGYAELKGRTGPRR